MEAIKICTSNAPVIKFRSKFQKQFDELPTITKEGLKRIFTKFIADQDDVRAAEILWKMTYNHFSGLGALGIREQDKFLNDDILVLEDDYLVKGMRYERKSQIEIPTEMIEPLRNELRFQRKQVHPNFLVVHYPNGCKEAFKGLLHATNDPVLTYVACSHCYQVCYLSNEIEINRILFLLGCTKKENAFGGIRSLRFDKYQAELFQKYTSEIRDYLEACWVAVSAEKEFSNTPLAGQLEAWRNEHLLDEISTNDVIPENTEITENEISVVSSRKPDTAKVLQYDKLSSESICTPIGQNTTENLQKTSLTARNILDDSEIFEQFASSAKKLENKGYNCIEAISMLARIEALLSARAILEGA